MGSYSPRRCGIATFSSDLTHALNQLGPGVTTQAIAVSDREGYAYPPEVCLEIAHGDRASYAEAALWLNANEFDVLSVQHEYGIFGGESGAYLLEILREVKIPIITTLHTVLREPTADQKRVLDEVLQLSERIVVMSRLAVDFLVETHGTPSLKIDLIPHGIPDVPREAGRDLRAELSPDGPMILTFGLLSPDKGIQHMIGAMPQILAEFPGATYVIVGATHPHVQDWSGESYRESLESLVDELNIRHAVRFDDRFVSIDELTGYLGATDIYATPYLNPKQITSGTLAYAVGAGRAVISTPYWYAEELLSDGRGTLVGFGDSQGLADAALALLRNPTMMRDQMRQAAEYGVQMRWPHVAVRYHETFARAKLESARRLRLMTALPPAFDLETVQNPRLDHLFDLSDAVGICQHATFTVPNRHEGYCLDDNARALIFTVQLEEEGELTSEVALAQGRYLAFVNHAHDPKTNRFRNFMSYGREWLEQEGSEDSMGRALWALGTTARGCRRAGRRALARALFRETFPSLLSASSPRTWAYGILAAHEYLIAHPDEFSIQAPMHALADRLGRLFESCATDDWLWFENSLAYANTRLSQAMIVAGVAFGEPEWTRIGIESLDWLLRVQTSPSGVFVPIGSDGFYSRGGRRALFDQQPIEAASAISACLTASEATENPLWADRARRAFGWFLGDNLLGLPLFDPTTCGCRDGLRQTQTNENQGAESTLAFLSAALEIRRSAATLPVDSTGI